MTYFKIIMRAYLPNTGAVYGSLFLRANRIRSLIY